jgi:carboxylesterase type B
MLRAQVIPQNADITTGSIVASQLLAYKGRDDKLFAHAIAESGSPARLGALPTVEDWEPVIARISSALGCANATSAIACLRTVPVWDLNAVLNSTVAQGGGNGFVLDGDFMVDAPATQLNAGDFVHVPYLIGANSDEGTGFGPGGISTTEQFLAYITQSNGVDNATAQDLAILYPDIPNIGIPASLPGRPDASLGLQFKRSSALATDTSQMAPRRFATEMFAKHGVPVYSYRFNVIVNGQNYQYGVTHFQEVAFVFVSLRLAVLLTSLQHNTEGLGYPQNGNPNPLGGPNRETYLKVAKQMTRMWISFANFGDPNMQLGGECQPHL